MSLTYSKRRLLEKILRKSPNFFSDFIVDILTPFRKKKAKEKIQLKWITLFITNYCSAKCGHCFYNSELNNKIEELNIENLKKIFSTLESPLITLRITGGEPFFNRGLEDFCSYIDQNKISKKINITSHGMIPNLEKRVEKIIKSSKYTHLHIGISLDGLENTHDNFRKIKDGFKLAVKHLKDFRGFEDKYERFSCSTTTSLIRSICENENKEKRIELIDLIDFLKEEIDIKCLGFDHVRSVEGDVFRVPNSLLSTFGLPPTEDSIGYENLTTRSHTRANDVQLSVDEIEQINDLLSKTGLSNERLTMRRLEIEHEILKSKKRIVDCMAGYVDCVIYPSLDVAVCESTKPFANLTNFDLNLPKLLNSSEAVKMRNATSKCACTHPCHLSDSMAYDSSFLKEYFKN